MMNTKEQLTASAKDFKNFLIDSLNCDDSDHNISSLARAVGLDPSTMNRYINSDRSHLPAFLIPLLPDNLRTALLHRLDNQSGNPIKGHIDTSSLDGSIRNECDGIVEALGMVIHLQRIESGTKTNHKIIKLFQDIRRFALQAEQEIGNNVRYN